MKRNIEKQSLIVGCFANLIMAAAGWAAFYFSGSEALLLDGNFSFVLFLTGIFTLILNYLKSCKADRDYLDHVYCLFKSLLIFSVLLIALSGSLDKIYYYINGCCTKPIETGIIAYYVALVVCICSALAVFYNYQNKRTGYSSGVLKTEAAASMIDGLVSSAAGLALIVIAMIDSSSPFVFMLYIGDALAILILAVFMIRTPVSMIVESYRRIFVKTVI
ncbi:cation transporter [Psychromonas aquimarina]|uniref:cation transporter n=1 Tax=Psychromonas aquimarina TaxID=444919 RepID=UPI0004194D5D|nr:cation transporter [Psychromonas aquimarina]